MYATLSYDVNAGPEPIEDVREALLKPFDGRDTCDLLSDTFICEIDTTEDYLEVVKDLKQVAKDFPGQFQFVFTLHRAGRACLKLRMFHEASSPVRTPSYMPKGIVQFARLKNLSRADDESERFKGPVEMWLIDTIPFGHHSNGQNGCLFQSQTRDGAGTCAETTPSGPKAINKIDGSFSTNYVEAALHYGRMYLVARDNVREYGTRWEWRARTFYSDGIRKLRKDAC